ncbi:uncharacterized protein LOC120358218 [Solenopsis invicta]|uniref:uncharacterized protein LOC120358218 n=1 Tax=Solenopsis invicta TaxID=13686 RepID=UPI00193CCAF5|nr:uncharacterized protein LOC120358218 [Solenopsis invicta]
MATETTLRDIRATKLRKATYSRWKIEIRDALESYQILEVTTRRTTKPSEVRSKDGVVMSNVKEIDDWRVKDSKAWSVI